MLVSASAVSNSVRTLCFRLGIVLCEPEHFPLPVLLHAASLPIADDHLSRTKLQQLVRLGEVSCEPLQRRWRIVGDEVRFRPRQWSEQDRDDLLWLQDELSDDLFDLYDALTPGRLDRRVAHLQREIAARERAYV